MADEADNQRSENLIPEKQCMYKCIFFDLDHTLWDYETNAKETLYDLHNHFDLVDYGIGDAERFSNTFKVVNEKLWDLYDREIINSDYIRRERFIQILKEFGTVDDKLALSLSYEYLERCPKRSNLMPYAIETLEYLSERYNLTVITNGFEETQNTKITSSNLHHYFDHVITSQKAKAKKPAREIFEFALQSNAIGSHQAMMVGDNLVTDIGGARNASIDVTFFNPFSIQHTEQVQHEISSLQELCSLL
jgi:putative hydrolase of the HAD superfamily